MADDGAMERLEKRIAELERRLHDSETRLRLVENARFKLARENESLREENAILKEKVKDLTAKLGLNSANSSMPPSSDKPWSVRKPKWNPMGRRPGGQPGHEAHIREPFEPKDVDRVVPVLPPRCVCDLRPEDVVGEGLRHQVVDLPRVLAEVIEYLLLALRCRGRGHVTKARLPAGVPEGLVGPRLQAVLSLLTGRGRQSRREAADMAAALFGERARVSLGMVVKLEQRTGESLAGAYDDALAAIQSAPFVHADETGWTEARKPAWLWTAATPLLRLFRIDRRRNREAFRRLLFAFTGILITDRFSVYRIHDAWLHSSAGRTT